METITLRVIQNSTTQSGDWLPGECPIKAGPCGNPPCADETMRGAQINASGSGNPIAQIQSQQAIEHGLSISKHCGVSDGECPLVQATGLSREEALKALKAFHSQR